MNAAVKRGAGARERERLREVALELGDRRGEAVGVGDRSGQSAEHRGVEQVGF
ncbi:MAG: hypothetical protein J0I40_09865 [Cellulomonas sp.]|nr:hypothetical protein [Cellulomonas sp.]